MSSKITVKPVEYLSVDSLYEYENNPRVISAEALKSLMKSIKEDPEYFEARPIIASNRTGLLSVIAGNQRLKAAKKLKMQKVPVIVMENLTEEKEIKLLLKDNSDNFGKFDWSAMELMGWGELLQDETLGIDLPSFMKEVEKGVSEASKSVAKAIDRYFRVYFQDEPEQDMFFHFLGKLKDKYPEEEVVSQRILAYLAALQKENEEIDDVKRFLLLIQTDIKNL